MVFILSSLLPTHYYDKRGHKRPVAMEDVNGIRTAIFSHVKKAGRVVYVANDSHDIKHNTRGAKPVFKGLKKSGLKFRERFVLDDRNREMAADILRGADLVILSGGKILCQITFFREIGLADILRECDALVIGVSAGAMNLCKTVANFPEEKADLGQPTWVEGMGFYDEIVIPHFDGETLSYQLPCDEIDVVNDYVLPLSEGKRFIGIPNDGFILVDGESVTFHGKLYDIADGRAAVRGA